MIKPEFWDDSKLAQISRDARLTYLGLWTNSDDYGVVKGDPDWLRSQIFPYGDVKPEQFLKWLSEIEHGEFVVKFTARKEDFYFIPKFLVHQKINRPSTQRNPAPPSQLIEDSVIPHGTLTDETETETEVKQKQKAPPIERFRDWRKENPSKLRELAEPRGISQKQLDQELIEIEAWIIANTENGKANKSKWGAFANRWLSRVEPTKERNYGVIGNR